MARTKPGGQPTAVLIHPDDSDIKFTVRKPTRQQWHERRAIRAQRQVPTTIPDPADPEKQLHEADGKLAVVFRDTTSFEDLISDLRLIVTKVEGVGLSFDDALPELLEEWLDVTINPPIVNPDGSKTSRMDAATWIWREVAKKETFDADPLAKGSVPQ
jgi:hypothetical protein